MSAPAVEVELSVNLAGLRLRNPVLAASGCFGYGVEYEGLVDLSRIGGFVTKSLTLHPKLGNPTPRLDEAPAGMLNAIGLENCGLEVFLERKAPLLEKLPCVVLVSVASAPPAGEEAFEEYARIVAALQPVAAIDGYEINISCPNVKTGCLSIGTDPKETERLARMLAPLTTKPLLFKLSPNVTSIEEIALAAVEGGADGLSLINTLSGMSIEVASLRPRIANVTAGLSGPAIRPVGVRMVHQVYRALKAAGREVPLVGLGGIASLKDLLQYMIAGATAVQVGTMVYVDPPLLNRLPEELAALLREAAAAADPTPLQSVLAKNTPPAISELVGALRV